MSLDSKKENKITFSRQVKEGDPLVLIDFLETHSKLSKSILKKVLNNGGVWLRRFSTSKRVRNRRATTELNLESHIEFFYDPKLNSLPVPEARVVFDQKDWGLWYKPSGLLSQGTEFGDHCSILRQVEKIKGNAFLVHRLDREAHGVILIAYHYKAAAAFSALWQKSEVKKFYKVEVLGDITKTHPRGGEINFKLDGKEAKTSFTILSQNEYTAILLVQIHTGRLHQIRRHFDQLGFPVIGDPKYGVGNKNDQGIKLLAYQLIFKNPLNNKEVNFELKDVVF